MKETQHTECKESWREDYLRWVCGFANATLEQRPAKTRALKQAMVQDSLTGRMRLI